MGKCIHADLMIEYAKDAMDHEEPWRLWMTDGGIGENQYHNINSHPSWNRNFNYKRKPKTININGYEVPEPYLGELEEGKQYYSPCIARINAKVTCWIESDGIEDLRDLGVLHIKHDSALIHATALLSFTKPSD